MKTFVKLIVGTAAFAVSIQELWPAIQKQHITASAALKAAWLVTGLAIFGAFVVGIFILGTEFLHRRRTKPQRPLNLLIAGTLLVGTVIGEILAKYVVDYFVSRGADEHIAEYFWTSVTNALVLAWIAAAIVQLRDEFRFTREQRCNWCLTWIEYEALRCPHCTSYTERYERGQPRETDDCEDGHDDRHRRRSSSEQEPRAVRDHQGAPQVGGQ